MLWPWRSARRPQHRLAESEKEIAQVEKVLGAACGCALPTVTRSFDIMAPLAAPKESKTPYQLDLTQTTQACKVLLKHIADERTRRETESGKANLLADRDDDSGEDEDSDLADVPIWMIVSTKKHIADQKRLKPSKIPVPHSFNTQTTSSICLITADPQRAFKDAVAHPSFPADLRARIGRVIGISKLKAKYKSYESRRQLFAEHDIFLADDRIVTHLPKVLGKVFYKGGSKRPVPVNIAGQPPRGDDGKKIKKTPEQKRKVEEKGSDGRGAATPADMAKEILKSLASTLVHLSPSVSTAVKVGRAAFTAEQCSENIKVVVNAMTEKFITKGWRNVRGIHIKGPETVAFPIWLSEELWVDEEDVLEEKHKFGKTEEERLAKKKSKKLLSGAAGAAVENGNASKRKADDTAKPETDKHIKKKRKPEDVKVAGELAEKKQRLKKQKAAAMAAVGGSVL
ncbi:hypothetical protein FH972_021592 [Carpinus fangiana]|uniref:Ribosomal protein L1 n=1 Tax=Carpinus fangiana TaxID=176857 RepID=A0A5N6KPT1_9ROSI|nr:hypothetical protein FH972_021592 [Carpinus fangiana]